MSNDPVHRVVHLVPRDGLGGVEAAVRSLRPEDHDDLAVFYMAGPALAGSSELFRELSPTRSLGSPMVYWKALRSVLASSPEVLVCSLWRATLVGLVAKCLRPRIKLVVMIHATTIAHLPDKIVTTLGCKYAAEVWCDSEASRVVAQRRFKRPARAVSFLVGESPEISRENPRNALDFVYWGRHVHFKNVPRAVRLFNRVLALNPGARLFVYGQEGPATEGIRQAMQEAVDPSAIQLLGAKPPGEYPDPIPSCTFFIMTSRQEGMAVAVVEAMQLGLIPVVTPVGEIANYCKAGHNAIVVDDDEKAALEVAEVSADAEALRRMSGAAISQWAGKTDYSDDFKAAYTALLTGGQPSELDDADG